MSNTLADKVAVHLNLPYELEELRDFNSITAQMMVQIVDMTDNAILQEIINYAKENKICDVYLLDKKFVKEALEKQIPKKPIKQIWVDDEKHKGDVRLATKDDVLTKDNHGIINLCPNCEEWVMRYKDLRPPNDKDYYCKHCGQALDWSDTE